MEQFEFMHYRSADKTKGATVAILPLDHNKTALITVSRCGPYDNFNKKIGRSVASGRIIAYMNGRSSMDEYVHTIDIPDGVELKKAVAEVLEDEMAESGLR